MLEYQFEKKDYVERVNQLEKDMLEMPIEELQKTAEIPWYKEFMFNYFGSYREENAKSEAALKIFARKKSESMTKK